jgi:hypothetical protein
MIAFPETIPAYAKAPPPVNMIGVAVSAVATGVNFIYAMVKLFAFLVQPL